MAAAGVTNKGWRRSAGVVLGALFACAAAVAAPPLPADLGGDNLEAKLPAPPHKHWVWVNDFVFPHMTDGRAYLVDGDSGTFLGMLSTGFGFGRLVLPRDGKVIYSPETYFSRGTRGTRTDVVTIYDAVTLHVQGEIGIPAKRVSNLPVIGDSVLTDDDRFLLIYNFTPAQSITVVDTQSRTFVGEIETPGCAFALPTGPRSFFSLCADGGVLAVELDATGHAAGQQRVPGIFEVTKDPVTEKPVRVGDTWYFVTFDGRIVPVRGSGKSLVAGEPWWLTTPAERAQGWRPGGLQQIAVHAATNRLYALVHRGSRDTHKDPGKDLWVYDLTTHQRVQKIALHAPTSSIQVSTDDQPLLFGAFGDSPDIDVYSATSGKLLRTVAGVATSPTMLLTP